MILKKFELNERVCIITGGAGLLGEKHAQTIIEAKGIPVLLDINENKLNEVKLRLGKKYDVEVDTYISDITDEEDLISVKNKILEKYSKVDILINNAANNPKMEEGNTNWSRLENFPVNLWDKDIAVGLTGAFLCSKVFGSIMQEKNSGVILNISSDLGIIAPDQRIYRKEGLKESEQSVKPVTYSVVKHGLIGLTKYLATFWNDYNIRVNAICPGGIYNNQDEKFVKKLTNLIPMKRMADKDEYMAAVLFMISDASSYMTGSVIIIDGGRTCW